MCKRAAPAEPTGPGPFSADDLYFDAETGTVHSDAAPLHPNSRLILEVIGRLRPASVHEVGCGLGDHLAAIAALFPGTAVSGGDRAADRIAAARRRHPELADRLGRQDVTMPHSRHWPRAELVFCQAQLMHEHAGLGHFVALANMLRQAEAHVLLVENPQSHNFVADLRALFAGGHLDWEALHIHLVDGRQVEGRQVAGGTGARGLLLSRRALDYPPLDSDRQIRAGLAASARRLKRADAASERAVFGFGAGG